MKKLIIFDLDGTLLDTLTDLQNSVNFALGAFSFPLKDKEHIRLAVGNGVAKLMERSIPNGTANPQYFSCLENFKNHYAKHYDDETHPYEGIKETVLKLKKLGYKTAVATNKINSVAHELVNKYFSSCFDYVLGDIDGVPKKPHPTMINNIIKHFNFNKEECFYIGDTNVDEQTGLNAQIDYVLVSYGFRTEEEIKNTCSCKTILSSTSAVYDYFKNLI